MYVHLSLIVSLTVLITFWQDQGQIGNILALGPSEHLLKGLHRQNHITRHTFTRKRHHKDNSVNRPESFYFLFQVFHDTLSISNPELFLDLIDRVLHRVEQTWRVNQHNSAPGLIFVLFWGNLFIIMGFVAIVILEDIQEQNNLRRVFGLLQISNQFHFLK